MRVVARARTELGELLGGVEIVHIGATALPDGLTKGDVDVNVRVPEDRFDEAVAALSMRYERAQQHNWTATYASFVDPTAELPLGVQVTVLGSRDDFLVELHRRLAEDPAVRDAYNRLKQDRAPQGAASYWQAKNEFLGGLHGEVPTDR